MYFYPTTCSFIVRRFFISALIIASSLGFIVLQKNKFGLNVCGEGGEYETFTLDCSLFKKKIVM